MRRAARGDRARARDGARCSARSSLARAATSQSGAGCGDVNCIGTGRDFSVGRDVSCSFVSSACAEPCVTECLCLSRRRPRSSLRGPVAALQPSSPPGLENPRNGECGRSSRSRFVYVGPRASSFSRPAARIPRRARTRLFLLCFVSKMQTPTSTDGYEAGPVVERSCFCSSA